MQRLLFQLTCLAFALANFPNLAHAQPDRWQQRVDYQMTVDMNTAKHQYEGTQRLTYTNNSPDTLHRVFYHLYFNAFQPGSMMDVRSRTIVDPDKKIGSRIAPLSPDEQGWIKVKSLRQNGKKVEYETNETILEVELRKPILPNSTALLEMEWEAQVPVQIRRSGRNNAEGIDYSMAQWYPKLCEYDNMGWHANPYVAREFYGVWGDFDVKISIDSSYVVAAGGYLQNPLEVGCGYEPEGALLRRPKDDKLTWHFRAENVHDFVWAADSNYVQATTVADGVLLRFFWQKGNGYDPQWEALPAIMARAIVIASERFGKYPYREYAFIQGGDGGMEYPLATLITGNRPLKSLVGVSIHELMHSWYQMMLGTNESLHAWMDEGFTSYAEKLVSQQLAEEGLIPGKADPDTLFAGEYREYRKLALSGKEEPLTTHADYFEENYAYGKAAYTKGSVFMRQLGYIIGEKNRDAGLLRYFDTWKFKHPNPYDCIRIFEKQCGLELDWYMEQFVNTTNTIDYGILSVENGERKTTRVAILRKGRMAMPLDILVTYSNGKQELFYAPLDRMRGEKPTEPGTRRTTLGDHRTLEPGFVFEIPERFERIAKIEIDPKQGMADVDLSNNTWEALNEKK
ncbi:MAG: M1 family metallopeptidase [Saprospiraceae bacterium]